VTMHYDLYIRQEFFLSNVDILYLANYWNLYVNLQYLFANIGYYIKVNSFPMTSPNTNKFFASFTLLCTYLMVLKT
jgi:hypothetical protein